MGWFDGASDIGSSYGRSSSHGHKGHHSSSRKHSSGGSIFGFGGEDKYSTRHHNSSRSSFLNFAAGTGIGGGRSSSSSYYKRSPRKGYVNKMMSQARRLFRDLMYYLKKNPIKVFMLVIMPLITGGLLTGLLAKFGIRLPAGVQRMLAKMGGNSSGYGGGGGGYEFERNSYEGPLGGIGNLAAGVGGLGTAMSMAKMFM